MTSSSVTLSKEQAAILLPLLPSLAETLAQPAQALPPSSVDVNETSKETQYTNAEMFSRKRKNARSTAAQNHLLVSTIS